MGKTAGGGALSAKTCGGVEVKAKAVAVQVLVTQRTAAATTIWRMTTRSMENSPAGGWCSKCYCFCYSQSEGRCPKGGHHNYGSSGNYYLDYIH